jgi:hypothetical protein
MGVEPVYTALHAVSAPQQQRDITLESKSKSSEVATSNSSHDLTLPVFKLSAARRRHRTSIPS